MAYVIGTAIAIYVIYLIYKKVKDAKAGKFCSGGCSGCPSRGKCH